MSQLIQQGGIEELRNVLKQHFDKVEEKHAFLIPKKSIRFSLFNIIYMQ
jgi:hypothetical protein